MVELIESIRRYAELSFSGMIPKPAQAKTTKNECARMRQEALVRETPSGATN